MSFVCFNGNFLSSDQPIFTAQNRSFKWGDGVFETIKVYKGKILLKQFHFDRLFLSLRMLQIEAGDLMESSNLAQNILDLCHRNQCQDLARVRLAVFRNEGSLAEYVIEALPLVLPESPWNKAGLAIDIYPYARKNMDAFSNLKTANFLPYVLADRYARSKSLSDAIVLNGESHICDTSRANIFLVRNEEIYTPALNQGCVNGVMRRFLIDEMRHLGIRVHQKELSEEDLLQADEVFLTNSISDMWPIGLFRQKQYSHDLGFRIFQEVFSNFYA
jgi:branched-chain amino acid aminotransferase